MIATRDYKINTHAGEKTAIKSGFVIDRFAQQTI